MVSLKVVLSLITSGFMIVSLLLFFGVFQKGVDEVIESAGEVILSEGFEVLSFGNRTVSDLGGMQSTVRDMHKSLSEIFS